MLLFSLMFCSLCFALCVFAVLVSLGAFLVVLLASGSGGHVVLGLYVLSVLFLDFLSVFFLPSWPFDFIHVCRFVVLFC